MFRRLCLKPDKPVSYPFAWVSSWIHRMPLFVAPVGDFLATQLAPVSPRSYQEVTRKSEWAEPPTMRSKRGPSLEQLSKMRVGLLRRCAGGCVYGYVRVRRRRDRHSRWGHADDCGMAAEMTELSVRLRMASGGKPWRGSRRGRDKDGRGAASSLMEARSPSHTRPTRQLVCEGSHSRS